MARSVVRMTNRNNPRDGVRSRLGPLMASMAVAGSVVLLDPPSLAAVIQGTNANEELLGTPRHDVIRARGGSDLIRSHGGQDFVLGGRGNDTLWLGRGRDQACGGRGDDVVHGGPGKDSLDGGKCNPTAYGGADILRGGAGDDALYHSRLMWGGPGTDYIFPSSSLDDQRIHAGTGDDYIHPSNDGNRDDIWCGDGADTVMFFDTVDPNDVLRDCETITTFPSGPLPPPASP